MSALDTVAYQKQLRAVNAFLLIYLLFSQNDLCYWLSMTQKAGASTGFFAQVYGIVALIPPGKVMSYGQIANALNNICSARYVGYAMHAAPKEHMLPCHRVVNKAGEMAGGNLFGGSENQRRLLEKEGVTFKPNGRIDMAACSFWPFQASRDNIA